MTDIAGGAVESDVFGLRELLRIGVSAKFGSQLFFSRQRSVRADVTSSRPANFLVSAEDDP